MDEQMQADIDAMSKTIVGLVVTAADLGGQSLGVCVRFKSGLVLQIDASYPVEITPSAIQVDGEFRGKIELMRSSMAREG